MMPSKVEWVEDKRFERDGLCVTVQKLPLRWPRYSIAVGIARDANYVARYMPVRVTGKGKLVLVNPVSQVLTNLMVEAEEYILSELQYLEDLVIEARQSQEQQEIGKDKPRPRVGLSGGPGSGKTARKRVNKLKRQKNP
jgi:hypothetical protein